MQKDISDFDFLKISPSHKDNKKWDAIFIRKSTKKPFIVSFGQKGYLDFPLYYQYYRTTENMTPDDALTAAERKRSFYLNRHKKEDYDNPNNWYKPSFWAKQYLWGDLPDLNKQLKIMRKRFNF
jgi:hypothetical protein